MSTWEKNASGKYVAVPGTGTGRWCALGNVGKWRHVQAALQQPGHDIRSALPIPRLSSTCYIFLNCIPTKWLVLSMSSAMRDAGYSYAPCHALCTVCLSCIRNGGALHRGRPQWVRADALCTVVGCRCRVRQVPAVQLQVQPLTQPSCAAWACSTSGARTVSARAPQTASRAPSVSAAPRVRS